MDRTTILFMFLFALLPFLAWSWEADCFPLILFWSMVGILSPLFSKLEDWLEQGQGGQRNEYRN